MVVPKQQNGSQNQQMVTPFQQNGYPRKYKMGCANYMVAPPHPRFPSNRWRSPNPTHRSGSRRRRQLQRSFAPDGLSPSLCDPPTARQCRTCLTSDIQGFTSFKRLMAHLVNAMHWPSISKLRHLCMFSGCSLSSLRKASSQQSSSGGSVEQNQSKFNWSLRSDLMNLLLGWGWCRGRGTAQTASPEMWKTSENKMW